jgi:RNA polymerase sigma-70 factor (ECF subfamily)
MGGPGTALESSEGAGGARAAGEARLAHQAAAGDGAAFAALYDRYELAVFNVCARVLDTPDEAAVATQRAFLDALERWPAASDGELELDLDLGLLAAAHDACAGDAAGVDDDEGAEAQGEPDAPAGAPAPERYVDPERAEQLASLQEDVRRANRRLSERHREVLALRDLEGLHYEQIAAATGAERESVIESLARARVSLRDALRDSSLAGAATKTPECSRGLALLAMRVDGQLDDRDERQWLDDHLGSCETCRASLDAMQEARIAYRAWLPLLPPPWLRVDTLAEVEQRGGPEAGDQPAAPWDPPPGNGKLSSARSFGAIGEPAAEQLAPGEPTSPLSVAVASSSGARDRDRRHRRRVVLAVVIPLGLLGGAAAAVLAAGGGAGGKKKHVARTATSSAPVASAQAATPVSPPRGQTRRRKQSKGTATGTSTLGLRTTPTQPTAPQFTPPTTSSPAPVSRVPRRTTAQQPQSIGGGNENRTPRQPAPSRPTPTPTSSTPVAPTGTSGSSGASSP